MYQTTSLFLATLLDAVSVCLSVCLSVCHQVLQHLRSVDIQAGHSRVPFSVWELYSLLSRQETRWFFEKKNDASPDMTLCRPN